MTTTFEEPVIVTDTGTADELELREPDPARRTTRRVSRLWRGRPDDPRWVRPALLALLGGTALLYLWDLGASGWSNAFYSAAVQAGTKSWKAFFFGSSDAANFITVDKPPASLWVMEISARIFGVNSWSILVPQALEGVAAVGVLYATVRRWFSPGAGLIAGAVMATTPVAALMFRFNNPDALLVLLLTVAAYAMVRAHEDGRTRWLVLACALVGHRFHHEDDAGVRRHARVRARVSARGSAEVLAPLPAAGASPASRCSSRRDGGSRSSSCGPRRAARTSAGRRTTAFST